MAQQAPFRLGQQLIAPVERRAERLVSWQRGAPTDGQQRETVIETVGDLPDTQGCGSRRGKLDCERNAVKAATDGGYPQNVLISRKEIRPQRLRPRHEELHGAVLE